MAEAAENIIPLSRRTLVRGAAWTTPVIAVATTAPAFAASAIPCPVVGSAGSWSATRMTGTPSLKVEDYTWYTTTNRWVVYQDNSSLALTSLVFETTSAPFAVVPRSTVNGSFDFYWGYGGGSALLSAAGTFEILLNGTTVLKSLCRSGTSGVWTTQSIGFVAPAGSTTATLTYRFTIDPPLGKLASDDVVVGVPVFGACTVN